MKKRIFRTFAMFAIVMCVFAAMGCKRESASAQRIAVISREAGSGTRSAFVELFGVSVDGNDAITVDAEISNSTGVLASSVQGNPNAIGYVSMGALSDAVRGVSIDGVAPTVENIINGVYPVSRPFLIATKGEISPLAQDFINFILSDQGQAVVSRSGYIGRSTTTYSSAGLSGRVVVGGSSSVAPLMERLREAYLALNPNMSIEVQSISSSAGMKGANEGTFEIGMSSRALSAGELAGGLTPLEIAIDGIAVIVNASNDIAGLTKEQVRNIYLGKISTWNEVK